MDLKTELNLLSLLEIYQGGKKIKFPRKSWATPRSQACSQSITKQSIPGSLVHKIMQIFVFLLLCNQQNDPWSFFSGSSKLSGAIPAVIFGGIAPIANVACARPSTEVEWVFVHFPISSITSVRSAVHFKLLPWLFLLQEDRGYLGAWKESSFC